MLFWIFFTLFCLVCYIIGKTLSAKKRKIFGATFFLFLVFISAFRYNIGGDYESYIYYYENVGLRDFIFEPSFLFIMELLDNAGFTSQMLFVVYTALAFPFVYFGIRYLSTKDFMLSLVLFSVIPTIYWRSFGFIRQFVGVAIIFWGIQYIEKRIFWKYFLIVALATFFHSSAIAMLPLYFICHLRYSRYVYILAIILSLIAYQLNIVTALLYFALDGIGAGYVRYLEGADGGGLLNALALIPYYVLWLWIVIKKDTVVTLPIENIILNMVSIGLILQIITFDIGAIRRITFYFDIFRCVLFAFIPYCFTKNNRILVSISLITFFSLMFLTQIYTLSEGGHQDGFKRTIDYEFNFDLLK